MGDHQEDTCIQDVLDHMLLQIPTKKRKTITGVKTVKHPYTNMLADAVRAIYPAQLIVEATQASKELFCCWWRSLTRKKQSKLDICAFFVSVGTHPSYTNCTQENRLDLNRAEGADQAYITRKWKSCIAQAEKHGGNLYDASTLDKSRFRDLLRELDLLRAEDGKLTMTNAIVFCLFENMRASHGSRMLLLQTSGFEYMSELLEEFRKATVRNSRFMAIKAQLGKQVPTASFDFFKEMQYVKEVSGYHITNIQACASDTLLRVIRAIRSPATTSFPHCSRSTRNNR